ncbi:MAG: hypothetical protein H7Z12_01445 [Rhodospirillaceae bacterium]|nr:hypothetical protein [Rhodospirillales bacterium]
MSPLLLAAGLLAAVPAAAAERALDLLDVPVSYTADFSVSGDKGTYHGTVWHAPGRERRDFGTQGGSQTVLLRRDTDSAYLMKPSQRWYVGLGFQAVGALAGGLDALTVERTKLKEESVGSIRATRYKVAAVGPKNTRFDGDAWFSKEGILVRAVGMMTGPDGRKSAVETMLSGLKVGRVEERMFELPAGWLGMDLRSVPAEKIAQAVENLMPMMQGGR